MSARSAAYLLGTCIAMASFAGCHGDSEIPQVAQVAQQQTYIPPDPAHEFTDLAPAAHILPATARDYLPGSGGVQADGSYHYSLPIEVPPGRGEVTPQLSLEYSSRAGNGPLGVGWNVGGLSAIHRCDAIVATDNIAAEGERLCLDGALMVQIGAHEFRTENDMIAKIVRLGDSDFNWRVYLKDHRIRYYGRTYDQGDDKTDSFPLAEEHDRSGNIAQYIYKDTAPPIVQSIQYTFHNSGAEAQREIVFNYKERPDPIARRVSGETYRWDELLDFIEMKAPNPDAKATIWTYSLGYETSPDTGYSRLTTVTRCGAAGGCSYAREFDYSRWSELGGDRFEEKSTSFGGDSLAAGSQLLVLDVDGDGDDDVVYADDNGQHRIQIGGPEMPLSGSFEVSDIGDMSLAQPVDIDGDGASEIAVMVVHGSDEDIEEADTWPEAQAIFRYEIWRWNTDTLDFELVPGVLPANAATLAPDAFQDPTCRLGDSLGGCEHLFFADLNGDMLPDIVKPWDPWIDRVYQPERFDIFLNTGGAFGPPMSLPLGLPTHERLAYHTWFHTEVFDGRHYVRYLRFQDCADCVREYDTWIVGLSADGIPETFPHGNDPWHDGTTGPKPIDMDPDGDGVRELRWLAATDPWYPSHIKPIRADVDGDGREDVVLHDTDADTISIQLSKTLASSSEPVYAPFKTLTHDRELAKVVTGDFDGDGRVDIAGIESGAGGEVVAWSNINEWNNVGIATIDVDLVTSVRDTDGAFLRREDIVYRNQTPVAGVFDYPESAEPPAVTAGCSSYPVVCVRRGMTVVSEHATYKPTTWVFSSERRTRYSYFHPYADALGRGFLGFQMIRSWEPELAVESEVQYENTYRVGTRYPFAFIPSETLTTTLVLEIEALGRELPETSARARVVYTSHDLQHRALNGDKTYVVNDESTNVFEWEEDVDVVWDPTQAGVVDYLGEVGESLELAPRQRKVDPKFDDYGNVIAQTATTNGGVRSEFTLDYEPANTSSWLVDLPKDYRFRSWTPSLHGAPSFRHVRFQHDTKGRLTTQWVEPTSTNDDIKQTITYERDPAYGSYGQVTGVTRTAPGMADPRFTGVDWHDLTGEQIFPSREWNGLAHTTTFVHHPAYGLLLAEANPDGVETLYQYDDLGRPRGTAVEGGDSVELTYAEKVGQTLEVTATTASGDVRSTYLDKLGRPTMRTVRGMDGNVKQMTMSYNVLGVLHGRSNWSDGVGTPEMTLHWFDTLGRPRIVSRPDGKLTTTYAGLFEATHYDAKSAKKRQIVDVDGRLVETYAVVDGVEVLSSRIEYKPFDLPGITRDADNDVTELWYDHLGRRMREEDPNVGTTRLFYNGFGEIRRAERGTGTVDSTVYNRDVLGRIHTMDTVDGTVTFRWDAPNGTGKLGKEFSADGTRVEYRYDDAGRVSGSTWWKSGGNEWFDLDVNRDEHGRVIKTIYPEVNGQRLIIANVYEGAYVERVEDVTDPLDPKPLWTITERAADGALSAGEFGDGLAYYAAQYDEMGQPTRLQAYRGSSDYLMDIEYTPDANGNVERREDHVAGRVETFGYDELHRLREWTNTRGATSLTRSFVYDPIGNLEKVLSGATVLEEFVDRGVAGPQKLDHSTGGVTYDYDHRGRQIRAGTRSITYNAFDLPRRVTRSGTTWNYQYTASGERFRETDSLAILERIYVGGLYERHKAGSNQTHVHHVHGPDGPVADIIVNASGRRVSYVVPDAIGSTAVRFDETLAPGAAPERLHYEPFGRRIEADGSAWAGSWGALTLGFAGVEQARMELIQMGGRAYDPAQRRFLSPDPLVSDPYFDQARHRYSYAHNNPATITDPTGYSPTGQWGAVPPAWLCGYVSPLQLSFGSYAGADPMSTLQVRTGLPDVTPDSYRTATPAGPQFTGAGYAGGDVVARALIDHGVDAWLQENGDAAINVSLGVSYAALTVATYGMAAEAGVFAGMSARVASFGASSWRAITGVAGVVGEGARRYGNQITRWGAQIMRADRGAGTAASSAASGGPRVTVASGGGAAQDGLTLVRTLERGESWVAIQDEMRYLQWSTKQEHYLISFKDGAVRLFSGGEFRTTFEFTSDMRRLLMHTHPKVTGPSGSDLTTIGVLGQRSSWLLEPGMPLQRFRDL